MAKHVYLSVEAADAARWERPKERHDKAAGLNRGFRVWSMAGQK